MEARGFSIQLCENVTLLSCADVRMKFRLSEVVHRPQRSQSTATGVLRITLSKHDYVAGTPSNLTAIDSDGNPIEAQLNGLAVRLRTALLGYEDRQTAGLDRTHAARALAVQRECASWHEWAAKEAAEGERAKLQALLLESNHSDTCERIRHYLDRVKVAARARGIDVSEHSALGLWITHEKLSCDLADPLTSRIAEFMAPSVVDPKGSIVDKAMSTMRQSVSLTTTRQIMGQTTDQVRIQIEQIESTNIGDFDVIGIASGEEDSYFLVWEFPSKLVPFSAPDVPGATTIRRTLIIETHAANDEVAALAVCAVLRPHLIKHQGTTKEGWRGPRPQQEHQT